MRGIRLVPYVRPLTNFKINNKLSTLCPLNFRGVFDEDSLPKFKSKPHYPWCIVVNTLKDTSQTVGHWVVIMFGNDGKGYYFDPLGEKPKHSHWIRYLRKYSLGKRWTFNKLKVQNDYSNLCGHLCILYIMDKMKYP